MRTVFLLIGLIIVPLGLTGQTRAELEQRRAKTLEDISYIDNMLRETSKERSQSLNELNILNRKITLREDIINGVREEIALLNERIALNDLAIQLMEEDLGKLIKEYERAIVHAQRVSKGRPAFAYIFSASDLNQGYKRIKHLQQVAKFRRREAEIIRELKGHIELNRNLQEKDLDDILELRRREERQVEQMMGEQQGKRRLVNTLTSKERQLQQDLREKQRIAAEIEKEIARVIEEERKRLANNDMAPADRIIGDDFEKNRGRLPWPVERGVVTNHFGVHDHPVFKGTRVDNIGVEITSRGMVTARAVFKGKVMSVFGISGANMAVIIRHGKYLSVYQNLVNVNVKPGEDVVTGQSIGEVFSDPQEDGKSVIKFMIYNEKVKLNPEEWIVGRD
ncbi:MAG: peptidoglycan DD-metalloendopeptidase family protein [Bacteroidales bacterium]|nr:peptidoglycan DD-metalloendopeptidase family protein [Bacteroidales bacterium]